MIIKLIIEDKSVMLRALMIITGVNIDNKVKFGILRPIIENKSMTIIDKMKIATAM